jgi:alkanesulfonate monooxygenase SsuD/methylene tetrahydromethanopterin reductase-like flavin-dependent oxidoreductase (luciferase family)
LLAHDLATLDCLSSGRLVVGVGLGIDNAETRREFAAAGVPFEERVGRSVAAVRAWRALWSGKPDHPDLVSRYGDLRGETLAPTPTREGGPPVWIGSTLHRPASLERVGKHFDGWIPTAATAEGYAGGLAAIDEAARVAARTRPITRAAYLTVCLDEDEGGECGDVGGVVGEVC